MFFQSAAEDLESAFEELFANDEDDDDDDRRASPQVSFTSRVNTTPSQSPPAASTMQAACVVSRLWREFLRRGRPESLITFLGPNLEDDSFEGLDVPCAICGEAFEASTWSIRNELPCERICQRCADADDDYYPACAEGEEDEEDDLY